MYPCCVFTFVTLVNYISQHPLLHLFKIRREKHFWAETQQAKELLATASSHVTFAWAKYEGEQYFLRLHEWKYLSTPAGDVVCIRHTAFRLFPWQGPTQIQHAELAQKKR